MTIKEIIKAYLLQNGYDGLCNPDLECGCGNDDLFPCGECYEDCIPGYIGPDTTGEGDFGIYESKEAAQRANDEAEE